MSKPASQRFKSGDIIRYSDGVSALFRYEGTHNQERLYGSHVLGGVHGAADGMFVDLKPASPEDIKFCKAIRPQWFTDETRQSPTEAVSHAPIAWIAFAGNGNIQFWTSDPDRAAAEKSSGRDLRMFTLPGLVALAARAWPFEPQRLVDWTYLYALEGRSWPDSATIAEPLINLAKSRAPSQDDAERLQAGATLKQLNTLQRPESNK